MRSVVFVLIEVYWTYLTLVQIVEKLQDMQKRSMHVSMTLKICTPGQALGIVVTQWRSVDGQLLITTVLSHCICVLGFVPE